MNAPHVLSRGWYSDAASAAGRKSDLLEYHAAYYDGDDGWVIAEVLDYPGVLSQGRTLKDAQAMIQDALRLMAQCDIEEGRTLPRPNGRVRAKRAVHTETIPLRISPVG